eukprot:jgi/Galph1/1631/GphlegSOOS_G317.1
MVFVQSSDITLLLQLRKRVIRFERKPTKVHNTFMEVEKSSTRPIFDRLVDESKRVKASFHFPGHKRGASAPDCMKEAIGTKVFSLDLPELPALDNLSNPSGAIKEAQDLAAKLYSAAKTWFLVNGATSGILAAVLACCRPNRKVIVPRNVHQSVLHALVLSGSIPVYVSPEYDSEINIAFGISANTVEQLFQRYKGEIDAVLMVSPSYYGYCFDVKSIANICHTHDAVLLVDEAHGSHFIFHEMLPPSALETGADVVVHGCHKCLSSLTQTAMLHVSKAAVESERIDPNRISSALQLVQTTSPNYLLLASLDASREQFEKQGRQLLEKAFSLSLEARKSLNRIAGFRVLEERFPADALDPMRICLCLDSDYWNCSGYEIDEILIERYGVYAEMPSFNHLLFVISPGNESRDISCLVDALNDISQQSIGNHSTMSSINELKTFSKTVARLFHDYFPKQMLSPRDAFYHINKQTLSLSECIGKVSTSTVSCYPPGIPILLPGEEISADTISIIESLQKYGATITGFTDDSNRLQVI